MLAYARLHHENQHVLEGFTVIVYIVLSFEAFFFSKRTREDTLSCKCFWVGTLVNPRRYLHSFLDGCWRLPDFFHGCLRCVRGRLVPHVSCSICFFPAWQMELWHLLLDFGYHPSQGIFRTWRSILRLGGGWFSKWLWVKCSQAPLSILNLWYLCMVIRCC